MQLFIWEDNIKDHHASWTLERLSLNSTLNKMIKKYIYSELLTESFLLNGGEFQNGVGIPLKDEKLVDKTSKYDIRYIMFLFIARKPSSDLHNVVFPLFFIGLLASFAPLIKVNGGERISYIITTQLGNILMLTIIEQNTGSSTSGQKPRILDFYMIVQICCFYSLIGTSQALKICYFVFRHPCFTNLYRR